MAPLHIDRLEAAVPRAGEEQAVTGVVAPEDGRDPIEVSPDEQIRPPVAIEVCHQHRADRGELGFDGKRLEREGAVPVVQRDRAREDARFPDRRPRELRGGEDVLDAARAEVRI